MFLTFEENAILPQQSHVTIQEYYDKLRKFSKNISKLPYSVTLPKSCTKDKKSAPNELNVTIN